MVFSCNLGFIQIHDRIAEVTGRHLLKSATQLPLFKTGQLKQLLQDYAHLAFDQPLSLETRQLFLAAFSSVCSYRIYCISVCNHYFLFCCRMWYHWVFFFFFECLRDLICLHLFSPSFLLDTCLLYCTPNAV